MTNYAVALSMLLRAKTVRAVLLHTASLVVLVTAPSGATTYTVQRTVDVGTVTGTIETDGTLGTLFAANILDWDLVVDDGVGSFRLVGPLSGGNSQVAVGFAPGLSATATELLFDFSGAGFNFLVFQAPTLGAGTGTTGYWCLDSDLAPCLEGGPPGREAVDTALGAVISAERTGVVAIATNAAAVPSMGILGFMALAGSLLATGGFARRHARVPRRLRSWGEDVHHRRGPSPTPIVSSSPARKSPPSSGRGSAPWSSGASPAPPFDPPNAIRRPVGR